MTNPDVLAKRLLQRAHTRDGLVEILVGVTFLVLSGLLYAESVLPHRSLAFIAIELTFPVGLGAVCYLGPRWIKWARQRYLVEREGWVEHFPHPIRRHASWIAGAIAAVLVAVIVWSKPTLTEAWVTGWTGLMGGLLMAAAGRAPRFYLAGLIMAGIGLKLALSGTSMQAGFIILYGVMGAVELTMGSIVLMRFLRETDERS